MEPPSSIKHKTLPFLSIEDLESRLVFINTLQVNCSSELLIST
jgi:hypothetical protein